MNGMPLRSLALCITGVVWRTAMASPILWCPGVKESDADSYVAFRGQFELASAAEVDFRTLGASWYVIWLDGALLTEGPPRFTMRYPEYQVDHLKLAAGRHVIAALVHHEGVTTRMLETMPPFLYCEAWSGDREVLLQWKCTRMGGYCPKVRRINPQFGWIEWCDTRQVPAGWQATGFDDAAWGHPVPAKTSLGNLSPVTLGPVRAFTHSPAPLAQGPLAEVYGYELDNMAARFFLRDQACEQLPPQGVWRRYDLGRVRLMRPRFVLDLPAGAVVEFAYSESMSHGRVCPWITLSAGDSCNLDHYVARGGVQEFFPLAPRGGRFVEIHVLAGASPVRFVKEEFVERCYYDVAEGAFRSGDALLDRIWSVGTETHRACAEDALIDNPTRERGQWAGDVVTVGMDIAAAGWSDLRLCRRGLVQCAQCARDDGLVAGLCPGGPAFLTTYAAQWITACVHYWELTGDRALLDELFGAAERNIAAFEKHMSPDGLRDEIGWGFVDWGYVRNSGPTDMGVNLHYVAGLRDMVRWCRTIGKTDRAEHYQKLAGRMTELVERWFAAQFKSGSEAWSKIGYHRCALGLRLGFLKEDAQKDALAFMKAHMLSCFPNDTSAPRLSDPQANNPRLITPYFAHYAMPLLIERGEMDFVLDQYRRCWGWALEGGRTTWLEVFDTRWSHCHQWAGCPTWHLSRYVLGLTPRYDLGRGHYAVSVFGGTLPHAEGALPLPNGKGLVRVRWDRQADGIHYALQTPAPIVLHLGRTMEGRVEDIVQVDGEFRHVFAAR
jgi:alpha-L-rhamnosidase